ncbi:MAG: amidohydrolase/deacetylase family metallohydrolase [Bacteroidetes bacterium]|nr:amidohydrolase/deacetylase family metallohydrolase [Bacteroidota bacterium]
MHKLWFLFLFVCAAHGAHTQPYSILIKGGYVIDAKNKLHDSLDIAINDGKIVRMERHIDPSQAIQVVDARGLYVMAGLIDIHTHVYFGTDPSRQYAGGVEAIVPDGFTFRTGVTTIVDAGSSGWREFPVFKKQVIDMSRTRVMAFLNIVGSGMRGNGYEQDTRDMDGKLTGQVARQYHDYVVGVKVAHYSGPEWTPVDEAVKAGNIADIPVMVDFGGSTPPLSINDLFFKHLRPGDIFTHCFGELKSREPIVDPATRTLKPFVREAQKKGTIFDVGYGEISFAFSQAIPALKSGFTPNSLSTDIHTRNVNGAMKDLLNLMSKFMAMGMDLESVVATTTWNPAREIKHEELGNLSVGGIADVAILGLRKGRFGFFDYVGTKIEGNQKLECEMTIRDGKIVYDLNGIANPIIAPRTPVPATTHGGL